MCVFLSASAQENITMKFGFLSYEAALQSMGEYALVQKQMADLRTQYEAETKRVEDEFNAKYEDFLEGQREFPKTILQKRQTELQELMQNYAQGVKLSQQCLQDLARAEQAMDIMVTGEGKDITEEHLAIEEN